MKYDEISNMWAQDSVINKCDLGLAALNVPLIHNKYFKMFSRERVNLRATEDKIAKLKLIKTEYYLGTLDEDIIKANGWDQWERRTLKGDIPLYLEADTDMCDLKMKLAMAYEKVDFLESILKQITGMGWLIKSSIDWQKFQAGAL